MLTRFHRMILRMLPGPFIGWLGTLMFLLLMQFLIRYLPDLVGKGLPISAILELIAYSLAYMVVLAVPMSVLISLLMTFGKLAESRAYTVIKSAGVSLPQLIWPILIVGGLLASGMWYFNTEVLPEANFRAKTLWMDIRQKKPGFDLQPGVFYDGISKYSILVGQLSPDTDEMEDITIFDYSEGPRNRVEIKAERGQILPFGDGSHIDLVLHNGELHRLKPRQGGNNPDRYERLRFDRHRFTLNIDDFNFKRSDPRSGQRSDRTMRTKEMVVIVDSLRSSVRERQSQLFVSASTLGAAERRRPGPAEWPQRVESARSVVAGLDRQDLSRVYSNAAQKARLARTDIDNAKRTINWQTQRADRYAVEIHKKYSIALACLIFMLVGAPLGLSVRRGGLGTAAALAIGIFLFYWVTLVQGEKLADRGLLDPWIGMWIGNIVTVVIGTALMLYVTFDLRATRSIFRRIRDTLGSR